MMTGSIDKIQNFIAFFIKYFCPKTILLLIHLQHYEILGTSLPSTMRHKQYLVALLKTCLLNT